MPSMESKFVKYLNKQSQSVQITNDIQFLNAWLKFNSQEHR